jgi:uncharacterized protein with von Willebrand factor type A (vWA) domain
MAQAGKIPQAPAIDAQSAAKIAAFASVLRANGFAVGLAESRDSLVVLASPAGRRPSLLKPALRALFSATREDWRRFDELFDAFWRGTGMRRIQPLRGAGAASPAQRKSLASGFAPEAPHGGKESGARDDEAGGQSTSGDRRDAASQAEALASRDIRHIADPREMAKVHALAERFARRMRARLVRRWRARRAGPRLDLRRTIHRSVAHGGTPIDLVWRRRKLRPLRLVLLLDASGSMELYTAFFARFLHAAVDAFREAEAFVFHTRLVHVSSAMRERDVARAVDRLALMAQGIGGGTRIGESLADFNRWHAARVINSRTAVVIVSDGYDTGEPEQLGAEMQRLARRSRRIVWLNPLLGWRDYEPTARGMQAALPYIDLFAPAHNLESLAALEPYLARI